jgi:MYXO-CTERM domain-containing protein
LVDGEIMTGFAKGEVVLGLELTIGEEDRGVNRIEVTATEDIEFTGTASLYVDGDAADGSATVDGQILVFEAEVNIDTDGAQLELRFDVVAPAEPGEMGSFHVVLKQGLEACATEVDADLPLVAVVGGPGDDDTPGDDDDDTDGCECRADTAAAPGAVGVVLALLGLATLRWRRQSRSR